MIFTVTLIHSKDKDLKCSALNIDTDFYFGFIFIFTIFTDFVVLNWVYLE
jgi:hypothetical protein